MTGSRGNFPFARLTDPRSHQVCWSAATSHAMAWHGQQAGQPSAMAQCPVSAQAKAGMVRQFGERAWQVAEVASTRHAGIELGMWYGGKAAGV